MTTSKRLAALLLSTCATLVAALGLANTAARAGSPIDWLFPDTKDNALPPDDGKIRTVPSSKIQLTIPQIRDFYAPPDWYPEDHPVMPPLVVHGVKPGIYACGYCHLPSGNGRPENANIAGLPADYIVRQVEDMKSGARSSSVPEHFPQKLMIKLAADAATDPGLADAAAYFAAIKPRAVVKVVETDTIPKVDIYRWVFKSAEAGGTEPLGNRLVELADDFERFELRDGHITYTTYVPPGSIAKGEALVKSGGSAGKAAACATCHGPDLKGLGAAPPIAGRSPSYFSRQLYDFRGGARNGKGAELMKPIVANLTDDDIIAITAYVGTLAP
jgi:cytochrome c553